MMTMTGVVPYYSWCQRVGVRAASIGRDIYFSLSSLSWNEKSTTTTITAVKRNMGSTSLFFPNNVVTRNRSIAMVATVYPPKPLMLTKTNNNESWIVGRKRYKSTGRTHQKKKKKKSSPPSSKKKKDSKNNGISTNRIINPKKDKEKMDSISAPIISFIHSTASPYAYIATCAAVDLNVNPKELFVECRPPPIDDDGSEQQQQQKQVVRVPTMFQKTQFEYRSPKKHFKYELPTLPIPEVAVLGRSNVGKSSLLNALMMSKNKKKGKQVLARTSKTPGRTQQVNFFEMTSTQTQQPVAHLIDLPGYGYAKAPEKKVDKWQETTQDFLEQRRDDNFLQRVYLLLDGRHGALDFDNAVMGWLDDANIPYTLVFTKGDSVSQPIQLRHINDVAMRYHQQFQFIHNTDASNYYDDLDEDNVNDDDEPESVMQSPITFITSSKTGNGIAELMWSMDADFLRGREILNS